MVSQLAMDDIADLEGQGITLAPCDIVILNELGLRVEQGASAGDVIAAPRIGWAGDVPIYEPTVQSEAWIDTYANRWWGGDGEAITLALLYSCAHATRKGFFCRPELQDKTQAETEIRSWQNTLTATEGQLQVALRYALFGDCAGSDVVPTKREDVDDTSRDPVPETYAIDQAIACGLGITIAEMETLTQSRLYGILTAYYRNQGTGGNGNNIKAHADYIRTLDAIKRKYREAKNG